MNVDVPPPVAISRTWVGRSRGGTSRVVVEPNAMVAVTAWLRCAAWARIHAAEESGLA
jgi:hypothetical protein